MLKNIEKIHKFLEFLNAKVNNLKLVVVDLQDTSLELKYNKAHTRFSISPNSIKNLVSYRDKLMTYNGRVKIKFKHCLHIFMDNVAKRIVESYIEKLQEKLPDFGYSSKTESKWIHYYFEKGSNTTENFELNTKLKFIYNIEK